MGDHGHLSNQGPDRTTPLGFLRAEKLVALSHQKLGPISTVSEFDNLGKPRCLDCHCYAVVYLRCCWKGPKARTLA